MAKGCDIAVPVLNEGEEYHCFIAFSSKDEALVEDLKKYLEEWKFKVVTYLDFGLGHLILDDIDAGVKRSRRIVVIMSPAYLDSDWYDHESLLFIHNNSSKKKQLIIPVSYGLTEEEMTLSRLGVYNAQYLNYDPHNPDHKLRIAKAVAGPDIFLTTNLRCGDIAEGFVWNYYYGYIRFILPGLETMCENYGKREGKRIIGKIFILIPDTGKCHQSVTDCDPNITFDGSIENVEQTRAGVHKRVYKNTVYKIVSSSGEEYYAPCEYATPILSIYDMCQESLAGLTVEEKLHQIRLFSHLLDRILTHGITHDLSNGYLFKIIFFNADEEGRGEVANMIIDHIKVLEKEKQRSRHSQAKHNET